MKTLLISTITCALSLSLAKGVTIIATENFESGLGIWTATGGAQHYIANATNQPAGTTHNYASGGSGAADLPKSGGAITSTTMSLASQNNPDLIIDFDFQWRNGSSTRRAYVELSLDGGSNWLGLARADVGGAVANESSYSFTTTITEGGGISLGGQAESYNGGFATYSGETFTDNALIRISDQASAGADVRLYVDNLSIDSSGGTVIPEPSIAFLSALGVLMLLRRRRAH